MLRFISILALFLLLCPANAWGQASKYYPPPLSYSNAVLVGKDFSGQKLQAAEFANANLRFTNFSDADLRGAVLSVAIALKSNFRGADLSYALADQVDFSEADLRDAVFVETLLLQSKFEGAEIAGADFSEAILDRVQLRQLCNLAQGTNPKTGVTTRDSLGCPLP